MNTIAGLFDYYENAQWAVEVLQSYGIDGNLISVVARDADLIKPRASVNGTHGSAMSLAGLNIYSFTVPEIGELVASGMLADMLFKSLGTTTVSGGLLEVLLNLNVPAKEAISFEKSIKAGDILVIVEAINPQYERRARAILLGAGATNKSVR